MAQKNEGLCLVVADRGHVWVGKVVRDGAVVRISGAKAVRRWGTTRGLNQLAVEGPQPSTVLDFEADVILERRALIALIPCDPAKW